MASSFPVFRLQVEQLSFEQRMEQKFAKLEQAIEKMVASVTALASKKEKCKKKKGASAEHQATPIKKKARKGKKGQKSVH